MLTVTLVGPDKVRSIVEISDDTTVRDGRYFQIPLVLADRKTKRYQRRSFYYKSCGRRYRDRRKRVIDAFPVGSRGGGRIEGGTRLAISNQAWTYLWNRNWAAL